jgi:putative ATP-binding cassette transporter
MIDRPDEATDASAAKVEAAQSRLVPQLTMMFRALLASPVRNTLFILSGVLVAVVAATAYGQIRLNTWNQPFYDALADEPRVRASVAPFTLLGSD